MEYTKLVFLKEFLIQEIKDHDKRVWHKENTRESMQYELGLTNGYEEIFRKLEEIISERKTEKESLQNLAEEIENFFNTQKVRDLVDPVVNRTYIDYNRGRTKAFEVFWKLLKGKIDN